MLPANGPSLPGEPNCRGSQSRKRVRKIVITATTTIIVVLVVVVIVAVEARKEILIEYDDLKHKHCARDSVT